MPDRPRRPTRTSAPAAAAGALAAAAVLLLGAGACGPSPQAKAYDVFLPKAEGLLQKEEVIWRQVTERARTLDENPNDPRFYAYLDATAAPFYDTLVTDAAGANPGPAEAVGALHGTWVALDAFAKARRDFIRLELARRELMKNAALLVRLRDMQDDAAAAALAYENSVGDDVPDARMGDLKHIIDRLTREYVGPAVAGDRDATSVADHLTRVAVPGLERLRDTRFDDDERSRLLRKAIVMHEESIRKLGELIGPFIALQRGTTEARKLAEAAEAARTEFRRQLAEAQLGR